MSPKSSPFKFLDSYQKEDIEVFFGRETETEELYHALSGVKHLLIYGSSGVGKTSLVECGLRNQFSDADWYALTIRRGNNIMASVYSEINQALEQKFEIDPSTYLPSDENITFGKAIERLFDERYQPIYLLFDQFEELLISGHDEEKEDFFTRLNHLIRYKVPCRVMLIMREEFIGHLSKYEPICPGIFTHRFRVEKMRHSAVEKVIYKMLQAPRYQNHFSVRDGKQLAQRILSKLPDEKQEIELTHVQVFLSELWDRANNKTNNGELPVLHQDLIVEEDNLAGVLDSFIKKQLAELESTYGKQVPLEVLAAMISERHTKLQLEESEIKTHLDQVVVILKRPLSELLDDLENRRIVRAIKSGDDKLYEISHDVLASVVGQNLTEEMKLRERATEVYGVYQKRPGFFSQEDLDYLRPFRQYKNYPAGLKTRIKESKTNIITLEKQELAKTRKQLTRVRGLLLFSIIAFLVAGYFWYTAKEVAISENKQRVEADTARAAADKAKEEAQQNLIRYYESDIQNIELGIDDARKKINEYILLGVKEDAEIVKEEKDEIARLSILKESLNNEIKLLDK